MKINIWAPEYQIVKWLSLQYRVRIPQVLHLCCEAWINTLPADCPVIPVEPNPVELYLRFAGRYRPRLPPPKPYTKRTYHQVDARARHADRVREAAIYLGYTLVSAWRLAVQAGVRALKATGQPTPPWIETEEAIPKTEEATPKTEEAIPKTDEAIPVNSAIAKATAEQVLWLAEVLEAGWAPCCKERLRAQLEARAKEIL